ncbi:hypoxia up-regulated protein 1-like isoform X1 [Metopolophium dirhodum]|uniref:hypoxia up-regulated protein 1-like isoform X1 n=2 Tax=Metopolophium dirhodum TaxID=44670 RepID=UPI0029903848|nr:hypoxia up-regulated protein 1-like isoform X1 [Metopolophium dirhodum]
MNILFWSSITTQIILLELCLKIVNVHSLTVMSVDLGSEWMKVAIVSPDISEEIALNKESKRKTPSAIAFRNGERTFGKDALTVGVRFPSNCYVYFLDLLGKRIDNPIVDLYKTRFPYYNIIPDPKRNTVLFKHNESGEQFSPEELVAMMLEKAREFAQDNSGQVINEAVISVPGYFGQAERSAMLKAAEIVGIKVLQLINSYTAAALNYGIFHIKSFNEISPMFMMFYDMGAYGTQVSVVSYQLVKSKDRRAHELQPKLTVLGVGYERNLGGLEIQLRLRDYLATKFNDLKFTPNDVTKNLQSMAKLFKEAGRLKIILSANTEHFAQIEDLIDQKDMYIKVTREELEQLCKDLFDKVTLPALKALEASGLTIDHIKQVMLVGAGTRVPRIQDVLVKDLKSGHLLGRSLNTDDAAALGAAYKAAELRNGFKVNTFITKDATMFPIELKFNREKKYESEPIKQVRRILFSYMKPYPQRKIVTFINHKLDFDFTVGYATLNHLDENEIRFLGSLSLDHIKLKGVQNAYSKYEDEESTDPNKINLHFIMDASGILVLENVEFSIGKPVTNDQVEESTLLNILNSIANLFKVRDKFDKDKLSVQNTLENSSGSKLPAVRQTIEVDHEYLFVLPTDDDDLQNVIIKLKKLRLKDLSQLHKEKALHSLLTLIVEVREKLSQPEYTHSATDSETRSISEKLSEISNWLGNDGLNAEAEELEYKYNNLKQIIQPVWDRTFEHIEIPPRLEALSNTLKKSDTFLKKIKNKTLEDSPITQTEIDKLEKLILETTIWRDKQVEEQERLSKYVHPVLSISTIETKHSNIRQKMKYLMTKFINWKLKNQKNQFNVKDDLQYYIDAHKEL